MYKRQLIALLVVWTFLTAALSPERFLSLRSLRSEWIVLTYFVFAWGIGSVTDVKLILRILAIASSIVAITGILQHITGVDWIKHKPIEAWHGTYIAIGLLGHHITFGVFYSWIFILCFAHSLRNTTQRWNMIWTGCSILSGLAVVYSYSRAAWLGTVVGIGVAVVLNHLRLTRRAILVLAVLAVAIFAEGQIILRARSVIPGEEMTKADRTRIQLIETSLKMIKDRPLIGLGPGTFSAEFEKYKVPGDYSTTCHPHNDILNFAVRSGIPGSVLFAIIIALALRKTASLAKLRLDTTHIGIALCAGLASIVASGLFQCNFTDSEVAIQAWMIIGLSGLLSGAQINRASQ